MKHFRWLVLSLLLLTSCSRTPESILSRAWGIDVRKLDHEVELFKDVRKGSETTTEIRLKVALSEKDINKLIAKGAHELPFVYSGDKAFIERLSGLEDISNGVYYSQSDGKSIKSEYFLYDRDSQTLYYYNDELHWF